MITLRDVKKSYHGKVIFENVNLQLEAGTVTAFIGHNGCGKSTMLKVISGLARRDCGEIIYDQKYRFAYVPEKFPAIPMTARAYLRHMTEIDGSIPAGDKEELIASYAKDFYLEDMLDKPMKNLSKGTLQKIGVIQALLSLPDVLLLDEPLSGQDADSQDVFVAKIKALKEQGVIILLSAHEPALIHSLGDKVYTIRNGRLTAYEEKPQLRYRIFVTETEALIPTPEMTRTDSGYFIFSDEQMLYLDIKRLQKEGWHIKNVYEDC